MARLRLVVILTSLPFAVASVFAWTSEWLWLGELSLHFSWLAAMLMFPALVLTWRRPKYFVPLLLCFIAGWWPWWRGTDVKPAPPPTGLLLAVASANLYDFNRQRAAALATASSLSVDLLGVQEILPADQPILAKQWPYAVWTENHHLLASALLSRHPIVWSHVHDLEGFALIDALVQTPGGELRVFVTHLASPKRPRQIAVRDRQMAQLSRLVQDCAEPVLVIGDFNASTISPHWRRFAANANLLRPSGAPTATWPAWMGPWGVDIDQIVGHRLGIGTVGTFHIPGSDHLGVTAEISLR